eukprot:1618686-Rhodomonas_salina.1
MSSRDAERVANPSRTHSLQAAVSTSQTLVNLCLDHGVLTWNCPVMSSDRRKLGEHPCTN